MKSLIITWSSFQDQEVVYPYYRLREETKNESDVKIMADVLGKFHGIMGVNMESHYLVSDLNVKKIRLDFLKNYDLLVIPGGVKALEKLRQEKQVLDFIFDWNNEGKVIASTCHGAQLLISAKIVKNRKLSGYYSIKDDINNSGAIYSDEAFVIDKNIVSSPHYNFMGEWMNAAINLTRQ